MSDQNNTPVDTFDDLDSFSAEFFGQKEAAAEESTNSQEEVNEDDNESGETDAPDNTDSSENSDTHEDDDEDATDEGDEGEDEEVTPKPKPKNRFQTRIDELTTARREAERRAQELEARLAALENPNKEQKPAPTQNTDVVEGEPTPEDKNEDGSEKYPLGEFDPNFIRDLTKHTLAQERAAMEREAAQKAEQDRLAKQEAEVNSQWEEKLVPARERYPDFQEKAETLVDVFSGLDKQYGEFLAQAIMTMDNGPDVLYYLANNQDEARRIVASGATKAVISLGRLEARFDTSEESKPTPRQKVTKAPTPPEHRNKGSSVAKPSVTPDTDDLDAFEAEFFKKRRR